MTVKIEIGKKKGDGLCKVYIKVSSGSTRKRIPTEVYLSPSEYSKTKSGIHIKNLDKKAIIDKCILKVHEEVSSSDLVFSKNVTATDISKLVEKKSVYLDFFAFADQWIEECQLKGKKNYKCAINSMKKFAGTTKLSFSDIDVPFLMRFEKSLEGKPRAQSSYLAVIRHLWMQADLMYEDALPRSPFRKYHPPRQKKVGQRAVDLETFGKIVRYSGCCRRAMLARDCFLLSFCLMGMNSADLYDCKILKNNVIYYDRMKTRSRRQDKAHMEVRVQPEVKKLVEKYRGTGNYVFNFHARYSSIGTFNTAINKGLKTILGGSTDVDFYAARHTWASIARNILKVDKSTVNDGLAHVDRAMDVTDLYIKKDYKIVNDVNHEVIKYMMAII